MARGKSINFTEEQEQDIMRMYYVDGYTQIEIGEVFGVSQPSIAKVINRRRIHPDKRPDDKRKAKMQGKLKRELKRLWNEHLSPPQLADMFGLTVAEVQEYLSIDKPANQPTTEQVYEVTMTAINGKDYAYYKDVTNNPVTKEQWDELVKSL